MKENAKVGRKAGSKIPKNETKAEKFSRLGTLRLNNAQKAIFRLRHLATSQYEYTPEQFEKVIKTLEDSIQIVKEAFAKTKEKIEPVKL